MQRHAAASAIALVFALLAAPAWADEMFLQFEGPISGDSTDPQFPGALRLLSYEIGVQAATSWTRGSGASVGKPDPGALRVTTELSRGAPSMLGLITRGLAVPSAVLTVRSELTGNRIGHAYAKYRFTGLFFTSVEQGLVGRGRAVADVAMVYRAVQVEHYVPGNDVPVSCVKWDVPSGVVEDC
jgi:type VI protein secretion system component Hcp